MPLSLQDKPGVVDAATTATGSMIRSTGTEVTRLRILIVSTPKTGNTWLKHMLMLAYDLPMVEVPMAATGTEFENLGARWICHQHFFPSEPIVSTLRNLGVILITTVRHPADILVSEFNYLKGWVADGSPMGAKDPARLLLLDGAKPGANTLRYVRESFAGYLLYSAAWLAFDPIVVRYETLCANPLAELHRITQAIAPIEEGALEKAVALCEIGVLRKRLPASAYHFRKGGSQFSDQEDLLPPEILRALHHETPYPEINARLGYSLDQVPVLERFDYRTINPLHGHEYFSNGIPISLGILKIYFFLPKETRRRWPDPADASGPSSFYSYLLEPIDEDVPVLTRLAFLVHQRRPDLAAAFPHFQTAGRWEYINWFIYTGAVDYQFHQALLEPILYSILHTKEAYQAAPPGTLTVTAPTSSIRAVTLTQTDGTPATAPREGDWVMVSAEVAATIAMDRPVVGLRLLDQKQQEFFACSTRDLQPPPAPIAEGASWRITYLLQLNVPPGDYHFAVDLSDEGSGRTTAVDRQAGLCRFVLSGSTAWSGLAYCHAKVISSG